MECGEGGPWGAETPESDRAALPGPGGGVSSWGLPRGSPVGVVGWALWAGGGPRFGSRLWSRTALGPRAGIAAAPVGPHRAGGGAPIGGHC